jgi:hypothetical protein
MSPLTVASPAEPRLPGQAYSAGILITHLEPYLRTTVFPVGVSVALPPQAARDGDRLLLRNDDGAELLVQGKILQRWADQSIRWYRLEWLHTPKLQVCQERLSFVVLRQFGPSMAQQPLGAAASGVVHVDQPPPVVPDGTEYILDMRLRLVDGDGMKWQVVPAEWEIVEDGQVFKRFQRRLELRNDAGRRSPLAISCSVKYYPRLGSAIYRLRVRNPQAAGHPQGTWDLGNAGAILIRELSIEHLLPSSSASQEYWIQTAVKEHPREGQRSIKLFQASSGGEHWNSRNHVDRSRQVPLAFRGFRLEYDGHNQDGLRATPRIGVCDAERQLTLSMRDYWENFPKSLIATGNAVRLGLFPKESGYLHELQGGEQKTHQWAISFSQAKDHDALAWYQSPSLAALSPTSYVQGRAIPFLTSRGEDRNAAYLALVDKAITGDETFFSKREKIDQYGWRNYGDLYGDHEAVFQSSMSPLISHYNNQYDCVGGFAIQFLRSGRREWWEQMIAMADHAWDIDTYHTDRDKNLYNGGLFWHTYHYADADTATHRSYPKKLSQAEIMPGGKDLSELGQTGKRLAKVYAIGGGPSASQNYSTGWMYAYFLCGEEDYREAAIQAADYVQRIEDGKKTIFRWLSTADTGLSIESSPGYHGPGRASANSLHALLTGYELTGKAQYLKAAEQLIQRVIHPADQIEKLDLLNAELRWFYTMFLQALMRYLDIKIDHGMKDDRYAYAWASLIHYARWMLEHEAPTLDHPERLQYPTETWAAQDMRKWHILQYVAWLNPGDSQEQQRLQMKADFFFDYVCRTLSAMPSHRLCRPLVLMMHFGWQRHWFQTSGDRSPHPRPEMEREFPPPLSFIPQRVLAIRRAKLVGGACLLIALALLVALAVVVLK